MRTPVTASSNHALDALLELICARIQLSESQDQAARQHYGAVASWLSREGSPVRLFNPHIFPQGSQRLGTTTRPLRKNEFDLDAICRLDIRTPSHPGAVYRLIWDRIAANEIYRPMMKRLPRCIRLEYSGDFHLDIAPAVPDLEAGGTCLFVPDLDADLALDHPRNDNWKPTNPQGHGDWFDDQCRQEMVVVNKYARAQVDPVPEKEPIHAKPALKRSVQLIKRWRDVEYKDRSSLTPPSIILTTLSGHLYGRQSLCTDALRTILDKTVQWIESGRPIRLTNPAHDGENICEKWDNDPDSYRDFCFSVTAFRDRWHRLLATRGIHEIEEQLSELFDEAPVQWAINKFAESRVVKPREDRLLRVDRGTGGVSMTSAASSLAIPPNTFFGDR